MTTRIFVDVTRTARAPFVTGIQRVVRQLVAALNEAADHNDVEIIPVVVSPNGAICVPDFIDRARTPWTHQSVPDGAGGHSGPVPRRPLDLIVSHILTHRDKLPCRLVLALGRPVWRLWREARERRLNRMAGPAARFEPGDVLLMPDSAWSNKPAAVIGQVRAAGGRVFVVWYDMIPILHPAFFDSELCAAFTQYLDEMLAQADGLIAISCTVHNELQAYAVGKTQARAKLSWSLPAVHLGPGSDSQQSTLQTMLQTPTILLLATFEPRKGHAILLDAVEQLWAEGRQVNLLFVGRVGWKVKPLMARLEAHPERERRLFVRHQLSDAEVTFALGHARCLVLPSAAEGLGLPVLEAEHHGCPVICTDLPVFREVAGPDTVFVDPMTADALAAALRPFAETSRLDGPVPRPGPAARRTPADYAGEILAILLSDSDSASPSECSATLC